VTGGPRAAADRSAARDPRAGASLRIAVGPEPAAWVTQAIERGGGRAVRWDAAPAGPGEAPAGLVWIDPWAVDGLRAALERHPGVAWVQLPLAGVENLVKAGAIDRERLWTSAKGAYAEPVAEHAMALLLAGLRRLPERARAHSWGASGGVSLFDQPLTVIGAGGVARELLRLLEPYRVQATVVRHKPEPLPAAWRTLGLDHLHEALRGARAVVLAAALTRRTRGLIGRAELAAMAPGAWLVNVARGELVDTAALVEALGTGSLGGAALDVTDPEPLPDGHPLWNAPNCLITPHTADTEEMTRPLLAARITENVRRLTNGEELVGRVDPDLGY